MRKLLTSLFLVVFAFFFVSFSPVSAKFVNGQTNYVVAKDEVVDDDLFVGGQSVEIDGTVNGDVLIGTQTVKITGTVNGSLYVGANSLYLEGNVEGNVYAGARTVFVKGSTIKGSLFVGGENLTVDESSSVGGSLFVGAGTTSLDLNVGRSVYAGSGTLTIGGNSKIGKNLYYAAGDNTKDANISENAVISGSIYKHEYKTLEENTPAVSKNVMRGIELSSKVISLIGALIVGFLYLKLFGKKNFEDTSEFVASSFWKNLGIGFLITLAAIPGFILLAITVVGLPVAGLAFLILFIFSYMAKVVVGACTGNWLSKKFNWNMSTYASFAIGMAAIYILKSIWGIGFLVSLVVLWVGLGALTIKLFSKAEK